MQNLPQLSVLLVSLWLYRDSAYWLGQRWLQADGGVHLVLAGLLLLVVVRDVDAKALRRAFLRPPPPSTTSVCIIVGATVGSWLVYHCLVPARAVLAMGGMATAYGVAGLFMHPAEWARQRGTAVLALGVLPITGHLDTFVGFPLRSATATVVATILGAQLDSSTVLLIEGSIAQIDVPCSGVQSLWSAAVVLVLAAIVWGQRISLRGIALCGGVALALMAANLLRVLVLVITHHTLDLPLLAEILHLPLGVLGFLFALAPALWILRGRPRDAYTPRPFIIRPTALWPVFAVLLLIAWLPKPQTARLTAGSLVLPAGVEQLALSPEEASHALQQGSKMQKFLFEGGSAVFVLSGNWMAQHVPQQCHTVAGWTLSGDHHTTIAGHPVRWASAHRSGRDATVFWWFQREGAATSDYTERVSAGLFDDTPWIMVSVLVHHNHTPDDPVIIELMNDLSAAATASLETS